MLSTPVDAPQRVRHVEQVMALADTAAQAANRDGLAPSLHAAAARR